jgi:hypothetical protein
VGVAPFRRFFKFMKCVDVPELLVLEHRYRDDQFGRIDWRGIEPYSAPWAALRFEFAVLPKMIALGAAHHIYSPPTIPIVPLRKSPSAKRCLKPFRLKLR